MKTIVLFRHGKSDWNVSAASDHDRPLARRGKAAASRMGEFLSSSGEVPEVVVTSSARRAVDTVARAARAGGWACEVRESDELYLPSAGSLLEFIRSLPDGLASVMLVGHEPAWSELLSLLVGGGAFRFPTAAMARVDLDAGRWDEVDSGAGELRWMVVPRLFG